MRRPEVFYSTIHSKIPFLKKEKELGKKEGAEIFEAASLIPILQWAYGEKNWLSRDKKYWDNQQWSYLDPNPDEKKNWPEEAEKVYQYMKTVLGWASDEKTRGHLDPSPGIPLEKDKNGKVTKWDFKSDKAAADLALYYYNRGEPGKITTLFSTDSKGKPTGVATIRWKGDKYSHIHSGRRIAGIERVIVDPKLRKRGVKGIGTRLVSAAIEYAFNKGYDGDGAEEIRTWIMQDELAKPWESNWDFFRNLGFQHVNFGHWPEYAKKYGHITDRGDASWLKLQQEWYKERKKENRFIVPYDIIELRKRHENFPDNAQVHNKCLRRFLNERRWKDDF